MEQPDSPQGTQSYKQKEMVEGCFAVGGQVAIGKEHAATRFPVRKRPNWPFMYYMDNGTMYTNPGSTTVKVDVGEARW